MRAGTIDRAPPPTGRETMRRRAGTVGTMLAAAALLLGACGQGPAETSPGRVESNDFSIVISLVGWTSSML